MPAIPATTAGSLARRFSAAHFACVEAGNAALVAQGYRLLPDQRRATLAGTVTIDMDSTDVEGGRVGDGPAAALRSTRQRG